MRGDKINTVQQIFDNLLYEADSLKTHIELFKDSSTLFMVGGYVEGDTQTIKTVLLGCNPELKESIAATMDQSEDIRDFIFEVLEAYFARSKNANVGVIKVSADSSIGKMLKDAFLRNNSNNSKEETSHGE